MLSGVIKPNITDKSGDIKCSNNYREVMIATNFFKIVQYMMLPFIKKINLSPYQFAYRGDKLYHSCQCYFTRNFKQQH